MADYRLCCLCSHTFQNLVRGSPGEGLVPLIASVTISLEFYWSPGFNIE